MTVRDLVLLADDDPFSREFLQEALQSFGCEVCAVEDGEAAILELGRRTFDCVVTDLVMPRQDGQAVLVEAKRRDPDLPVVLVTAHGTMGVAVTAMRAGADDVLEKPVELQDLEVVLQRVRERRRLLRENRYFRDQSIGQDLVVAGPSLQSVVDLIGRVAKSRATVLVRGESGTGKERIAALVHRLSDRAREPFVKLNCAAVPENLLESELFGHEAGAFTGAHRRREGRFELADRGTLFLDEVGEMSPAMQSKLLRVLQEGEFERVGGNRTLKVDVRVVAATNRELERDVDGGRFRADLFWRLCVVPVVLPPLRERRDEIVPLARHFLRPGLELSPDAEELLRQAPWPGNVRELQNVIERAGLLCQGTVIEAATLQPWLGPARAGAPLPAAVLVPYDPFAALAGRTLQSVEQELIRRTLERCGGNRTRTAELLGISVRSLFDRLKSVAAERG